MVENEKVIDGLQPIDFSDAFQANFSKPAYPQHVGFRTKERPKKAVIRRTGSL